ncbi:MAG TPA: hypothetical protein VNP98_06600 [Chthoniobacterales bacterium]|nr:hypothetical protein [Chthoniobacterales bacterium]
MHSKSLDKSLMALSRDRADNADKAAGWQDGKKAKPDERRRLQPAAFKVRMCPLDDVVEAGDLLMKLRANAANEPISERRHLAQSNNRTVLDASVGLRKRRESNIGLPHDRLTSACV